MFVTTSRLNHPNDSHKMLYGKAALLRIGYKICECEIDLHGQSVSEDIRKNVQKIVLILVF